jgi:hypothetical protein
MPPAVIAAGVGAAASIGGAAIASGAQKKSAKTAANSAQQTTAANNALARDIYNQNAARLDPYAAQGLPAGQTINAMLGLGAPQTAPQAQFGPASGSPMGVNALSGAFPGEMDESPIMRQQYGAPQPVPATAAQPNPQGGFRGYIANSDYAFNLGEGMNALNHGYAARGGLESGAAMKAMERFRQDLQRGYRGEYMDRLFQQQGIGLSGASALAGVGQGFVNNVTNNNNNAASVTANAALARGNATAGLWGNIAGGVQNFANSLGSSYGNSSFSGYGSAPGNVYGYRPTGGALGM